MRVLFLSIVLFLSTFPAEAGVLLVERSEAAGGDKVTSVTIRVDQDRIRADSSDSGREHIFIYRADTETMYMIDPQEKVYRQMTKQQLEQMMGQVGDQMAQMKAMMDEQLKNAPPEQRQMIEQMLKGKMAGMTTQAPKTVYRKVSSGEQVGRWSCDRYEGYQGNEKVKEVWTTDWRNLDLTLKDFQVLRDLTEFFQALASRVQMDLPEVGSAAGEAEEKYAGMPVRRISYRNGKMQKKHELVEVSRQEFEASLFEIPDGFQQAESPWEGAAEMTSPSPPSAPKVATAVPVQEVEETNPAIDCPEAIRRFRENQTAAGLVHQSCSPEIAEAVAGPAGPGESPQAASSSGTSNQNYEQHFSSEPVIVQGGNRLDLSAKRVIRTAAQTAARTAVEALQDYAVRKAIQGGIEKAVKEAAAESAASSLGGVGGTALSGIRGFGFGRKRGKSGFEFVVLETAKASVRAAAGEATFLLPARYRSMKLVRLISQEGFRVLQSRKGRVRKGQLLKATGDPVMEEIAWRLVQTTSRGPVYRPAQSLQSGEDYALVGQNLNTVFDFGIQ